MNRLRSAFFLLTFLFLFSNAGYGQAYPQYWRSVEKYGKQAIQEFDVTKWYHAVKGLTGYNHVKAVQLTLDFAQAVENHKKEIESSSRGSHRLYAQYFLKDPFPKLLQSQISPDTLHYLCTKALRSESKRKQQLAIDALKHYDTPFVEKQLLKALSSPAVKVKKDILKWFIRHSRRSSESRLLSNLRKETDAAFQKLYLQILISRLYSIKKVDVLGEYARAESDIGKMVIAHLEKISAAAWKDPESCKAALSDLRRISNKMNKELGTLENADSEILKQLWPQWKKKYSDKAAAALLQLRKKWLADFRKDKAVEKIFSLLEQHQLWQMEASARLSKILYKKSSNSRAKPEKYWKRRETVEVARRHFSRLFDLLDSLENILTQENDFSPVLDVAFPVKWSILKSYSGKTLSLRTMYRTEQDQKRLQYNRFVSAQNKKFEGLVADEGEHGNLLNDYRIMLGLRSLVFDKRLLASSRAHAKYMESIKTMGHDFKGEPAGETPAKRMKNAKYPKKYIGGENVCFGYPGGKASFKAFLSSPVHHENLLTPAYTAIGMGKSGTYWTQNFGMEPVKLPEKSK